MVIWIIGRSGVGKTYLSKKLYIELRSKFKKIIWIDGDKFRKKFSKDLKFSLRDRKLNSKRIQKHCFNYEKKNYVVICSILSIFKDHQKKNRSLFSKYIQVFIKANLLKLKARNNKKVYSNKKNVVGVDLKFPKPYKSNLIISNEFNNKFLKNIKKIKKLIYEKI